MLLPLLSRTSRFERLLQKRRFHGARILQNWRLYPTHQPTSTFQKGFLAVYSALVALNDPERADMVAVLSETTGEIALRNLRDVMKADPVGQQILLEKPILDETTVNLENLGSLPRGTFGHAYYTFMDGNGFSPEGRAPVRFVDDAELAYVLLRYRQVHDLWHALFGLPPTVGGELALKWLELLQTGLPVAALSAAAGPLALAPADRALLRRVYLPWALRAHGALRAPLMCVRYEALWGEPLAAVRARLGVLPAPGAPATDKEEGGE
mmetsp:Transcript_39768/g.58502  ORF Transcript_39768/g.58502 Transcript_39768/m.58502 type:complete len:267 (-) Transcript_39768:38-838(-)